MIITPNAGDLRDRVILQALSTTVDSHGEEDVFDENAWSNVATLWAAVSPQTGTEGKEGEQVQAEITHKVRLRYRKGVQPEMRVLYRKFHTLINGAINASVTTVVVDDAIPMPLRNNFLILCESELMEVTAGHGTTSLTVTRGANGTTAATHADNLSVFFMGVLGIEGAPDVDNLREALELSCKEVL